MEPWQKRPTAQLLMTMHELEGDPFFADPREVLRQVVARFTEMELTIVAAFELEFYLIDQENVNGRPQPPRSPISGKRPQSVQVYSIDDLDEYVECLQDIIDGARAQGIPADAIVAESAPAQFEVNLHHVADPMKACDYAVLLKRLIKNIAYDHEMDTTFMAKPYPGQAGNGLHVHISLLDKHGNNIFTSEDPEQNAALRHAIGGVLETLPASMAFLCPNVNSYRRFGSQFYVPNAPSWGLDNRTVALRVPTGSPDAVRLEHRVVRVLDRQGRQHHVEPLAVAGIELDQFLDHHLHRPTIGHDVVLDQHQYMVVFGQLQQVHPQQRPPFQVEWLHNDGLYPFDQAFFTELFPLDGNANRRLYLLVRTPSLQPEAGTQGFMPRDQAVEAALQGIHVQPPA